MIAVLATELAVWVLLDRTAHLNSSALRGAALLAIIASTVWLVWWNVSRPWSSDLSDVDLALLLERNSDSLSGDLASAVQFTQAGARPLTPLERELVAQTVEHFPSSAGDGLVDGRAIRSSWLWAGATCALLAGLTLWNPGDVGLALSRLATPWRSIEWPRRFTLEFRDAGFGPIDPAAAWRVAKGETLTVYVTERNRRLPERLISKIEFPDGSVTETLLPQSDLRDDAGQAQTVGVVSLLPQSGPLRIQVSGGDDDRLPPLVVDVATPPAVESFRITVTPPPYSGLKPETTTSGVGHVQGLVGSRVDLIALANGPLEKASLHLGRQPAARLEMEPDGRTIRASFEITGAERSSYWLELVDTQGLRHAAPPRYEIRGALDRPPAVLILQPETDLRVVPTARIPVRIEATDDLGLADVDLVLSPADGTTDRTLPGPAVAALARTVQSEIEVDLGTLQANPGDEWTIRAQARDLYEGPGKGAHVARSAPRRIIVVTPDEKRNELTRRRAGVAEALRQTRSLQKGIRDQVRDLEIQWKGTGALSDADRAELARSAMAQAEVRSGLTDPRRGALQQLGEIVRDGEQNGLAPEPGTDPLPALREEIERLDGSAAAAVEANLGQLQREAESSAPSSGAMTERFEKIGTEQDRIVSTLDGLLRRIGEWGAQEDLRSKVAGAADAQQKLLDDTRQLAGQTLSRSVDELSAQDRATLERLANRQARLADDVRALDSAIKASQTSEKDPPSGPEASGANGDQRDAAGGEQSAAGEKKTDVAGAAGKMQQIASLLQANRVQRAGELQEEVVETLRKWNERLAGTESASGENLSKALAQSREEAAGLRSEQDELRKQAEEASAKGSPAEREETLQRLSKRQAELQDRTEELARRLQKRNQSQPAASAQRSADRMQGAADALDKQDSGEASQQQREALDDLLQTERELARQEARARLQEAADRLKNLAARVEALAVRQEGVRDETAKLHEQQSAEGRLSRTELRTLQRVRESQKELGSEIEQIVPEVAGQGVLEMAFQEVVSGIADVGSRLEQRTVDAETQRRQTQIAARLRAVAKAFAPSEPDVASNSPGGAKPGGESPEESGDRLVLIAELKLLKSMQEELLETTTELLQRKNASGPEAEIAAEELRQLVRQQNELARLAADLIQRGQGRAGGAAPFDAEPEEKAPKAAPAGN